MQADQQVKCCCSVSASGVHSPCTSMICLMLWTAHLRSYTPRVSTPVTVVVCFFSFCLMGLEGTGGVGEWRSSKHWAIYNSEWATRFFASKMISPRRVTQHISS